jgi:hypothetical protein
VLEADATAWGIYRCDDGRQITCTNALTAAEMQIYRADPDNFFGVCRPVLRPVADEVDAFKFAYETYQHSTKEKLLEFLSKIPGQDIKALQSRSQRELARLYCHFIARSMMATKAKQL